MGRCVAFAAALLGRATRCGASFPARWLDTMVAFGAWGPGRTVLRPPACLLAVVTLRLSDAGAITVTTYRSGDGQVHGHDQATLRWFRRHSNLEHATTGASTARGSIDGRGVAIGAGEAGSQSVAVRVQMEDEAAKRNGASKARAREMAAEEEKGINAAEEVAALGTRLRMDTLKANMTVDEALRSLPVVPEPLAALLAASFGQGKVKANRSSSNSSNQANQTSLRGAQASSSRAAQNATTADVEEARERINRLIEEKTAAMDVEKIRCESELRRRGKVLAETAADASDFAAQTSLSRADVMRARQNIEDLKVTEEHISEELKTHTDSCMSRIFSITMSIEAMQNDSAIVGGILQSTSCAGTPGGLLIQCPGNGNGNVGAGGGNLTNQLGHLVFTNQRQRDSAESLRTAAVREMLAKLMQEVYSTAQKQRAKRPAFLAQDAAVAKAGGRSSRDLSSRNLANVTQPEEEEEDDEEPQCTLASNPDCASLKDRFMELQGGVDERIQAHAEQLAEEKEKCQTLEENLNQQRDDTEERSSQWETSLADSTNRQTEAQQKLQDKTQQQVEQEEDLDHEKDLCVGTITGYENEICALGKIRGELYKMNGISKFIVDCEVSDWTAGECSKSCEGGEQTLTRLITVPSDQGAACPSLEMHQVCNTQHCAIDCDVGEWSSWSACSAKCGGGIRDRLRTVHTPAQFGGKSCGATTETESCNVQGCDQDCVLGLWSKFEDSNCSKACGGGVLRSVRMVEQAATGQGTCANEDSAERLKFMECNKEACEPASGGILKCNSRVDVILLLDGSGSLGDSGFAAIREAGARLLESLQGRGTKNDTMAAALVFGGPQDKQAYDRCVGPSTDVDLEADCGIRWVEHFTNNTVQAANSIRQVRFPASSTFTSMALMSASAELMLGRKDAQPIVIVITDGHPINKLRTELASTKVKTQARLIWVPVTSSAPLDEVEKWASSPASDNVVEVVSYDDLGKPATLNRIIADTCPEVV